MRKTEEEMPLRVSHIRLRVFYLCFLCVPPCPLW